MHILMNANMIVLKAHTFCHGSIIYVHGTRIFLTSQLSPPILLDPLWDHLVEALTQGTECISTEI